MANTFVGDDLSQTIAVVGGICQNDFGRQALDQSLRLRRIAFWPAVGEKRTAHPSPRTAMWNLVLRLPRERPRA